MTLRSSFKNKAHETSASDSELFFNSSSFHKQSIQEKVYEIVSDSSHKQNVFDDFYKNDFDIICKNKSDFIHEISHHSQNSNTQDNSDFSDSQFMFLKKLHKHNEILKHLIDNTQKLQSLNQKHD